MAQVRLDEDAFAAWLRAQPPQTVCGVAGDDRVCPLATFLHTLEGGEFYDVGNYQYGELLRYNIRRLPGWALEFVRQIDEWPDGSDILVEDALAYLTHAALVVPGVVEWGVSDVSTS